MPTTALHTLVLSLTALDDGVLPVLAGELAHAAFYSIVHSVDPLLAQQMHDSQDRSAFALSPLYGYAHRPHGRMTVTAGHTSWMRVSLLDDQIFEVFQEHLLNNPSLVIRLGPVQFAITHVYGAPGSHPWAGFTTVAELAAISYMSDTWAVEFASPMAIRWKSLHNGARRIVSFPMPRMAIASLRTRWDKLTGDTWGQAFEDWVEHNITVSCVWHWHVESFQFQRQTYQGGVGKLEYQLLDFSNPANATHFHRLLCLAFYTGIGYKTAYGLGQVRLL
jgi:CRISPR-associated endoribonuclease Cas6